MELDRKNLIIADALIQGMTDLDLQKLMKKIKNVQESRKEIIKKCNEVRIKKSHKIKDKLSQKVPNGSTNLDLDWFIRKIDVMSPDELPRNMDQKKGRVNFFNLLGLPLNILIFLKNGHSIKKIGENVTKLFEMRFDENWDKKWDDLVATVPKYESERENRLVDHFFSVLEKDHYISNNCSQAKRIRTKQVMMREIEKIYEIFDEIKIEMSKKQ